jgi:hypothetical protein
VAPRWDPSLGYRLSVVAPISASMFFLFLFPSPLREKKTNVALTDAKEVKRVFVSFQAGLDWLASLWHKISGEISVA